MGNKNTVIRFLKDKGFYIALAVCIVGATAAAWATASRTLDSIEQNNRQIVEQGVSGEEKPQWSSSSTAVYTDCSRSMACKLSAFRREEVRTTTAKSSR